MFRQSVSGVEVCCCFPRMRGDVPRFELIVGRVSPFSPHARGCSAPDHKTNHKQYSFPRMRGDVPLNVLGFQILIPFSPHARGCSQNQLHRIQQTSVFPACAGMFLIRVITGNINNRFPRMRGDVPPAEVDVRRAPRFSPHARGCSHGFPHWHGDTEVFPACAGMFPGWKP